MEITSPVFQNDTAMPRTYTAEGENSSPPLSWSDVPAATKSLVLIVEDIDIPIPRFLMESWVHWIVYDIPPGSPGLPEGIPGSGPVPGGGTQGRTSWQRPGWGGPNPVGGEHRYVFHLSALDCVLGIPPRAAGKKKLLALMEDHVLARADLTGRYRKGASARKG